MLTVNRVSPSFTGIWSDIQFTDKKPVVHYYPFMDETKEEIQKAVDTKLNTPMESCYNPLPIWYEKGMQLKAIVAEPLKITKAEFAKSNRVFLADCIAKLLLK